MSCNITAEYPKYDPFTGCDGKPLSDDFLLWRMHKHAEEDEFEQAQADRDELIRRGYTETLTPTPQKPMI